MSSTTIPERGNAKRTVRLTALSESIAEINAIIEGSNDIGENLRAASESLNAAKAALDKECEVCATVIPAGSVQDSEAGEQEGEPTPETPDPSPEADDQGKVDEEAEAPTKKAPAKKAPGKKAAAKKSAKNKK